MHLLVPTPSQCLAIPDLRFVVVQESLQIQGYQMYAVEKWIVERNRTVTVLVVYTGDLSHKITVTAITPSPDLSPSQTQSEWNKALHHLRRDGARPKETSHGVLMATSLAHFRSDYTIVHIPDGNYLAVREQLYTNINLLRLGCSGRSALTLEEPSDTTKDRFISTYHLPEHNFSHITSTDNLPFPISMTQTRSHSHSHSASLLNFNSPKHNSPEHPSPGNSISKAKTSIGLGHPSTFSQSESKTPPTSSVTTLAKTKTLRDRTLFITTVLELVKLIQVGLAIFGMYKSGPNPCPLDGLLCDETVDGIRRWIIEVGEPCVGLEPMERIADPTFVAALLSLILAVRNKLAVLGFSYVVPKDPFLKPHIFTHALAVYFQSINTTSNPNPSSPSSHHNEPPRRHSPTPASPTHSSLSGHISPPYLLNTPPQITPSTSGTSSSHVPASQMFLSRELLTMIGVAYETKVHAGDGRSGGHGVRMRKALREKLRTGAGVESDGDTGTVSGGLERGYGSVGEGERGVIGVGGDRERDGGREGLSGVAGVAASGGQILSGIGNLASGLGLAVGGGGAGGTHMGAGAVQGGIRDMGTFVRIICGQEGKGRKVGKDRRGGGEARDALGVGYAYAYRSKEKEKDGGIGVSVRALWSGDVGTILRLREWEREKERVKGITFISETKRERERVGTLEREKALSDGDVEDINPAVKSETEEESDVINTSGTAGFSGRPWSERVQKKLESWTGIAMRRGHMSLDLSTSSKPIVGDLSGTSRNKFPPPNDLSTTIRPTLNHAQTMPLSPTLPPMVFVGGEADMDDDDLLSSGQVSPVDNFRPSPFHALHEGSSLTPNPNMSSERKIVEFNQKWPWGDRIQQNRVSSWADPVSAREIIGEDEDIEGTFERDNGNIRRKRGNTVGSTLVGGSVLSEEPLEMGADEEATKWLECEPPETFNKRMAIFGSRRRRSFHDLESLRNMAVLAPERMRVDVQLCGQLLIMTRREQHLQNIAACLQVLTNTLTNTNARLREDYQSHLPFLSTLEAHTQIISNIDVENAKADKTSQATHTLRYEAEQFRVPDLWHTATPPRQKVLTLREKVFGMGGRRLPVGAHGAHGRFNRLQWTLDGHERLVDHLGRTESEAAEEECGIQFTGTEEEEEEDVVEHPIIKPMWLLRFFTSWGARWGAVVSHPNHGDHTEKPAEREGNSIDER